MSGVKSISLLALLFVSLLLSACGGGGGGGGGGTETETVSVGAVTQLGSIYVNGVRYDTSSSSVSFDGTSGSESSIRVGQTVIVNGSVSSDGTSGTATTVSVRSVVKGPVSANSYDSNTKSGTLTILEQTVQITGQTVLHNITDMSVLSGDVEVHGHVRSAGVIEATYIEPKTLTQYKVVGLANNISGNTFTIGDLNIDTSSATSVTGLSTNALVEVKGQLIEGSFQASKVESATLSQSSVSKVEIEGFVTSFTSSSAFSVGTQPVTTSSSTRFDGGLPEEIGLASKLEVEGQLVNGVLQASKVSFRYNIKIEGDIESYAGGDLVVSGLSGITVKIDSLTEVDGTLTVNNHVRLRGYKSANGIVNAIRAEDRGNPDERLILQGPVEAETANSSITIMGLAISTSDINRFRDTSDNSITRSSFHDQIGINSIVKVRDDAYNGSSLTWDEAEIEYK